MWQSASEVSGAVDGGGEANWKVACLVSAAGHPRLDAWRGRHLTPVVVVRYYFIVSGKLYNPTFLRHQLVFVKVMFCTRTIRCFISNNSNIFLSWMSLASLPTIFRMRDSTKHIQYLINYLFVWTIFHNVHAMLTQSIKSQLPVPQWHSELRAWFAKKNFSGLFCDL